MYFYFFADNLSTFDSDTVAEDLVGTLQVLEITSPAIHKSLLPQVKFYIMLLNLFCG